MKQEDLTQLIQAWKELVLLNEQLYTVKHRMIEQDGDDCERENLFIALNADIKDATKVINDIILRFQL